MAGQVVASDQDLPETLLYRQCVLLNLLLACVDVMIATTVEVCTVSAGEICQGGPVGWSQLLRQECNGWTRFIWPRAIPTTQIHDYGAIFTMTAIKDGNSRKELKESKNMCVYV